MPSVTTAARLLEAHGPFAHRTQCRPGTRASVGGLLGLLDNDAGEFDTRADVELAEYLAHVEGHGVDADVHPVGDLPDVQSLGDQVGRGALGLGQAFPSGDGPAGRLGPVTAPNAEFAEPAPDAGRVGGRADCLVPVDGLGEVVDRLVLIRL